MAATGKGAPGITRTRPAAARPAALLGDLVGVLGLADRQHAFVERRQVDGVPFEALGAVVRQQVDAVGRSGRLGGLAAVELRENGVERECPAGSRQAAESA